MPDEHLRQLRVRLRLLDRANRLDPRSVAAASLRRRAYLATLPAGAQIDPASVLAALCSAEEGTHAFHQ